VNTLHKGDDDDDDDVDTSSITEAIKFCDTLYFIMDNSKAKRRKNILALVVGAQNCNSDIMDFVQWVQRLGCVLGGPWLNPG
jgi:hypothetical protein